MSIFIWQTLPSYEEAFNAFNISGAELLEPAEIHGLLCAAIVAGSELNVVDEISEYFRDESQSVVADVFTAKTQEFVNHLYEYSAQQLSDMAFDFELLVLDDEEDLAERAQALTIWCQGFLSGLHMAGIKPGQAPSEESNEAIEDIARIALMEYEAINEDDDGESAYNEIIEFVRMAVLLIYADFNMDSIGPGDLDLNRVLH